MHTMTWTWPSLPYANIHAANTHARTHAHTHARTHTHTHTQPFHGHLSEITQVTGTRRNNRPLTPMTE